MIQGARPRQDRWRVRALHAIGDIIPPTLAAFSAGIIVFALDRGFQPSDAALIAIGATSGLAGIVLTERRMRTLRQRDAAYDRFRSVYAASPAAIIETDLAVRIQHCNVALSQLLDLPPEDLLHRPLADLVSDPSPLDTTFLRPLITGHETRIQASWTLRHSSGRSVPVRVAWAAIADPSGTAIGLTCTITDLTIEHEAAQRLEQARARVDALFARAPIGIIEGSATGTITNVNERFCVLLGYRPDELIGTLAQRLAAPEDSANIQRALAEFPRQRGYIAERTYLAKDGNRIPVLVSTALISDSHGEQRLAAFVLDLSDVHAQRDQLAATVDSLEKARAEVRERQAFLEALLETVDVGIVSCDANGQNLLRNRAERQMLGLEHEDAHLPAEQAASQLDVLDEHGQRLSPDQYPLTRVLAGEDIGEVSLQLGPSGGPHRQVLVRGSQIVDSAGNVDGAVVALTDVTELRSLADSLAARERLLAQAQELGRLGGYEADPRTGEFFLSLELCRLWGFDCVVPRDALLPLMHPEDRARTQPDMQTAMTEGRAVSGTFRITHAQTGEERFLRGEMSVETDAVGRPIRIWGTHQDVTDLTAAERRAVEANALFSAILAATPDYTFVTDTRTGAVVYGAPGRDIIGITSETLLHLGPRALAELVHPEDRAKVEAANLTAMTSADGEVIQIRYRVRGRDNQWHWLSRRITPFQRDANTGEVTQVLGVTRDVTDLIEAEQRLAHAALHDPLTGLPNRALLMDRLDKALIRCRDTKTDVSVIFIDLDGFKRVNDTAGHLAGDRVLTEAAERLRSVVRDRDTVARVGGDEFVILVEPADRPDVHLHSSLDTATSAHELAERIRDTMSVPFAIDEREHVVTASVGITTTGSDPARIKSAQDVLVDADTAMYRAKHRGKDRIEIFEHQLRTDLEERGRIEHCLRQGIAAAVMSVMDPIPAPRNGTRRAHLDVAYQPVVRAGTGVLVGFEALARLTDEGGKFIPPPAFVSVAEDTGLIHNLGLVVLDRACAQLRDWRQSHPDYAALTMAVNLSAVQAHHLSLQDIISETLGRYDLPPDALILELTETSLLEAAGSTLKALSRLRDSGVEVYIDDFGTGYASLRYLAALPVSGVKVDQSFTQGIPHDAVKSRIVSAVIGLADDLGLACIVEGVERPEQRAELPDHVLLQGYLTGHPEPADEITLPRSQYGPVR